VADLHGKKRVLAEGYLTAVAHGELGGAQFIINLPRHMQRIERVDT
jgi:hypothetical protein